MMPTRRLRFVACRPLSRLPVEADGPIINDGTQSPNGPRRAAGLMAYSYWMFFVGNVLAAPGHVDGWAYETSSGKPGIWKLGRGNHNYKTIDAKVVATMLRHGNFDYIANMVKCDPAIANHKLPNSL